MKRIAETRKKSKSFLIGINEKCQPVSGKSRPSYGGDGDDIKFGNDLKWQKMPFTLKTKRILISHSSSSTPVFFRCVKHLYKRVCPSVRGFIPHVEKPPRGASDGQYWLLLDASLHFYEWVCLSVRPSRMLKNRHEAHLMASIGSCFLLNLTLE